MARFEFTLDSDIYVSAFAQVVFLYFSVLVGRLLARKELKFAAPLDNIVKSESFDFVSVVEKNQVYYRKHI